MRELRLVQAQEKQFKLQESQSQFFLQSLTEQLTSLRANNQTLIHLLVSKDFSTFTVLEQRTKSIESEENSHSSIATDLEEYKRWLETNPDGIGDLTYDDPDSELDATEYAKLAGLDDSIST